MRISKATLSASVTRSSKMFTPRAVSLVVIATHAPFSSVSRRWNPRRASLQRGGQFEGCHGSGVEETLGEVASDGDYLVALFLGLHTLGCDRHAQHVGPVSYTHL